MKLHTQQRDVDFTNAAKIVRGCYPPNSAPTIKEIASQTLKLHAPHYYVDPEYAYKRVIEMRKQANIPAKTDRPSLMWAEIFVKTMSRTLSCPHESVYDAVYHVVLNEPASSFFLAESSARRILRNFSTKCDDGEKLKRKGTPKNYLFNRFKSIKDLMA